MENNGFYLSSVKNALRILNSFSADEPEKKISDLAQTLGLAKSTVSRLMTTLASEGFVMKNPITNRYRLGMSILNLSGILTSTLDIHREAMPILHNLVKAVDETCHLVILDGVEVVYLLKEECSHPIRISSHVGGRNPAHCTSSGKAILAFQKEDVIQKVVDHGLHRYTPYTVTDPRLFRESLKEVREKGYSISVEEFIDGVSTVGAPIRDYTGQVVASITITGPTQRINRNNIHALAKKAVEVGKEISRKLGHYC